MVEDRQVQDLGITGIAFEGGYVLEYPDDASLLSMDYASGGYPVKAGHISKVAIFRTVELAESYSRRCGVSDLIVRPVIGLALGSLSAVDS